MELPDTTSLTKYINYVQENKLGLGNPSLENFISKNPTDFPCINFWAGARRLTEPFPIFSKDSTF